MILCAGFVVRRAQEVDKDAEKTSSETKSDAASGARQLLGMKGASDEEDDIWKIRLQLTKPVTWVPLIWGADALVSSLRVPHRCLKAYHG